MNNNFLAFMYKHTHDCPAKGKIAIRTVAIAPGDMSYDRPAAPLCAASGEHQHSELEFTGLANNTSL